MRLVILVPHQILFRQCRSHDKDGHHDAAHIPDGNDLQFADSKFDCLKKVGQPRQ